MVIVANCCAGFSDHARERMVFWKQRAEMVMKEGRRLRRSWEASINCQRAVMEVRIRGRSFGGSFRARGIRQELCW